MNNEPKHWKDRFRPRRAIGKLLGVGRVLTCKRRIFCVEASGGRRFTPQGIGQNYRPADGSKPIAQYSEINISNSQPFGAERHQGFDL